MPPRVNLRVVTFTAPSEPAVKATLVMGIKACAPSLPPFEESAITVAAAGVSLARAIVKPEPTAWVVPGGTVTAGAEPTPTGMVTEDSFTTIFEPSA